ncbi:MAG: GNAT family N-acetyltransferase, partial [Acidimicrobiia bacterium]
SRGFATHNGAMHPAAGNHPPVAATLPDVDTERLHLRRFETDDVDALAVVFAKREVWEFPYGRPFDRDETATFIANQRGHWDACGFGLWLAVEREPEERIVGYVGLCVPMFLPAVLPAVEVGWRFDPDVWGRGYASEAARAALDEAFGTLQLPEVCSIPQADNVASVAVADRIGMRRGDVVTIPAAEQRGALGAQLFWTTPTEWAAVRQSTA